MQWCISKEDKKKASQMMIDEVERKLKTLDQIDNIRKCINEKSDDWRPLGDCPLFNKIPTPYIFDCYKKHKGNKKIRCEVENPIRLCKIARKNSIPMKGD